MVNASNLTKPLINLAGKLDFAMRNAHPDVAETIQEMRERGGAWVAKDLIKLWEKEFN